MAAPTAGSWLNAGGSFASGLGSGIADLQTASGYRAAAKYAKQSSALTEKRTTIELTRNRREAYRATGGIHAAFGASGLESRSGSALDVLRESTREATMDAELIRIQGEIDKTYYDSQAAQYSSAASSSTTSGIGNIIGGILGAGAILLSDARMKTDVRTVCFLFGRRWVTYRYIWDAPHVRHFGVIAQEVPDAAILHPSGFLMVDYSKLGAA